MVWSRTTDIGCGRSQYLKEIKNPNKAEYITTRKIMPNSTYSANEATELITETFLVNSTILICNYGPKGNVIGTYVYMNARPCSQCPSNHNFCENGLCTGKHIFNINE